ncbi:hypothetical protein LTR37_015559 [Vermiconidia calcicola]|uniref:Uncharacterized protein n=1 Tax=Vermiconidia calcicola TaxID=1690605 RepID=A0ACC3MQF0_9PEZI|nr:hypothetical protein LTR37_015559 [Vermiconidia calcicola]
MDQNESTSYREPIKIMTVEELRAEKANLQAELEAKSQEFELLLTVKVLSVVTTMSLNKRIMRTLPDDSPRKIRVNQLMHACTHLMRGSGKGEQLALMEDYAEYLANLSWEDTAKHLVAETQHLTDLYGVKVSIVVEEDEEE